MPLEEGDHVTQKGTRNPTGIIDHIWWEKEGTFARVCWGTADKKTFIDDFNIEDLVKVPEHIWDPDAVIKRQAEKAGGKIIEEDTPE